MACGVLLGPLPARAVEPDPEAGAALSAIAEQLASADADQRAEAIGRLTALQIDDLPAIAARLSTLARRRKEPEDPRVFSKFRHAVGSRRADDPVDILPGVELVLAERRDPATLHYAELILIERALEGMGGLEAGRVLSDLLAIDGEALRWEGRRIVDRMGKRSLPTLLVSRSHRDPTVRTWARRGLRALDLEAPGDAVQEDDPALLSDILRAYGAARQMDAMPVVVSFVADARSIVRNAARQSITEYGRNAIWQYRRSYRIHTGESLSNDLEWEATRDALFAAIDARRFAPAEGELQAGLAAQRDGRWQEMEASFQRVLAEAPDLPQRASLAAGYAEAAGHYAAEGQLTKARRLYQRARHLSPDRAGQDRIRAELLVVSARESLSQGVVDLAALERALALAPEHKGALALRDQLTGAQAATDSAVRQYALIAGGVLLALLAVLLLRRRRPAPEAGPAADSPDATFDTLPG